jgi:hypothetical protein
MRGIPVHQMMLPQDFDTKTQTWTMRLGKSSFNP